MRNYLIEFLIILLFVLLTETGILYRNQSSSSKIAGIKTKKTETTVSFFIGDHRFTLFGYTSPKAKISFSGLGIFDETYADEKGFFIFKNRFSPLSPREACLTSQDVFGRLSPPLCLPHFPVNYNVEIGPVIMPPTISVDAGEYFVGQEAILSGQTIPNTEVDLSIFTKSETINKIQNSNNQNLLSFENRNLEFVSNLPLKISNFIGVKSVNAFSLPHLPTKSDDKGNFSVSLPTNQPEKFRIFSQANFANSPSPKSLTLNIAVLPWWMLIFKFFGLILKVIKERWLEVSLLVELIILTILVFNHFFHPHRLAKTRAIVLREKFPLLFNPSAG